MFRKTFKSLTATSVVIAFAAMATATPLQAAGVGRIGNTYYEDTFTSSSCNNSVCYATSNVATPTDAYVRIRHVGCFLITDPRTPFVVATIQVYSAPIGSSGSGLLKEMPVNLGQPIVNNNNNYEYFTVDSNPLYVVGPGRYIVFSAIIDGTRTYTNIAKCMISGDLFPLQQ